MHGPSSDPVVVLPSFLPFGFLLARSGRAKARAKFGGSKKKWGVNVPLEGAEKWVVVREL